jgi:hypothetical protein
VVDELLDELSEAKWFSCLDLRASFNQIRLAPGEEHKTAFQTHWGQFEFTVMTFGLTGAPNTFSRCNEQYPPSSFAQVHAGLL